MSGSDVLYKFPVGIGSKISRVDFEKGFMWTAPSFSGSDRLTNSVTYILSSNHRGNFHGHSECGRCGEALQIAVVWAFGT